MRKIPWLLAVMALAAFAAVTAAALGAAGKDAPSAPAAESVSYAAVAAWANYCDSVGVPGTEGGVARFPLFRLDTPDDYAELKRSLEGKVSFSQPRDEVRSLDDLVAGSGLGNGRSLLLVYKEASSGSFRFGVKDVYLTGGKLVIEVEQLNHPETYTADMAGWWLAVEVDASLLEGREAVAVMAEGE